MQNALADVTNAAERLIHLSSADTVMDIGCNDGTLIASYKTEGIFKIGFDPAENLATLSSKVADKVVVDFFSLESFAENFDLRVHRPKIITSIAMFYDLEDPNKFLRDIKTVMHSEGLWIIQMSYLPLMLAQNAFDNICHEHLEYYSMQSLEHLLKRHHFEVVDVELNDVNGGSVRVYIRNNSADPNLFGGPTYRGLALDRICRFREKERELHLDDPETYREFTFRVERLKKDVVDFVREKVRQGKRIYVYGASTKGNTLLQYFGLGHSLVTAAADRNFDKWGKVTVGTRIPIVSEEEARAGKPDYFLVLPWHFIEEFKVREKEYLKAGGRLILPIPHFTLI